jgi:hypothetical protein
MRYQFLATLSCSENLLVTRERELAETLLESRALAYRKCGDRYLYVN